MHSAWFRSTFQGLLKFPKITEGGPNFLGKQILQNGGMIWSPYFSFKKMNELKSSSFIRFDWGLLSAANPCPHPPNPRFKNGGIFTSQKYRKKFPYIQFSNEEVISKHFSLNLKKYLENVILLMEIHWFILAKCVRKNRIIIFKSQK